MKIDEMPARYVGIGFNGERVKLSEAVAAAIAGTQAAAASRANSAK